MENMHHLCDIALSSRRVLHLELVGGNVEPVLNLVVIAVTFILNSFERFDGLIEVVSGVIDIDHGSSEGGILLGEELFAWCKFFHSIVAKSDAVIVLKVSQALR